MTKEKAMIELLIEGLTKELDKYADVESEKPDLTKSVIIEVYFGCDSIAAKLTYEKG